MATLPYYKQFDFIEKDVEKMCKEITHKLAKSARTDMVTASNSLIKQYYDIYRPDKGEPYYYNRGYNLFNMIFVKPLRDKNKKGFIGSTATVQTGAEYMNDDYKKNQYKPLIYDLVWNAAHRGLPTQMNLEKIDPDRFKGWTWNPSYKDEYGDNYNAVTPHLLIINYMNKWGKICGKRLDNIIKYYHKSVRF